PSLGCTPRLVTVHGLGRADAHLLHLQLAAWRSRAGDGGASSPPRRRRGDPQPARPEPTALRALRALLHPDGAHRRRREGAPERIPDRGPREPGSGGELPAATTGDEAVGQGDWTDAARGRARAGDSSLGRDPVRSPR